MRAALQSALLISALLLVGGTERVVGMDLLAQQDERATGVVRGKRAPVAGALVNYPSGRQQVSTNVEGLFYLPDLPDRGEITLIAWAPGYYNTEIEFEMGDSVEIELRPILFADHPQYEWIGAHQRRDQEENCQGCHSDPDRLALQLPFDTWSRGAHANAARNPLFRSVYLGQDLRGNQSPPTRYGKSVDYGSFPLPPATTQPYFGPGYRLDFPQNRGNCALCHAPMAAVRAPFQTDPTVLSEEEQEGVSCDFCHKINHVILDEQTGLPHERVPGVLSYQLLRPGEGQQLFLGPKVDVTGDDSYSPLHHQSRLCAGCHSAKFWGVDIYNSYGEWLDSPYADYRKPGAKSCQDCHMPTGLTDRFTRLKEGGRVRDPESIHVHRNSGSRDVTLIQSAVQMEVKGSRINGQIAVDVTLRNVGSGHHLPTGTPLRHLVLRVEALSEKGEVLSQLAGSHLPDWSGPFSGQPGRVYAKVLEELWTGISPTIGYWNPIRLVEDNRIPAAGEDHQRFRFQPSAGAVTIAVELTYVRALPTIRAWKGWPEEQVIMA
ncbi:MAG: hypothetical protein HN344_02460, partial [Gammaproteobacteria bacterium]|nr:hypothetical protein [Gammaproteobacteria bacterium]